MFSVSDCLYLYQTAVGSYVYGSPTDLGWLTGGLLLAWAAWQPAGERAQRTIDGWLLFVAPVLTGLLNHRRLLVDLERALESAESRSVVAVFDLNGFKQYNDTFGHPAGAELLARLAGRLAHVVSGHGTAYRLGGDEFCVVLERGWDQDGFLLAGAARALSEHKDGFAIAASVGAALLPDEARTVAEALRLADQRMYAHKQRGAGPVVATIGGGVSTSQALTAS